MAFSLDEIDRYTRQLVTPDWGAAGQERVRAATIELDGSSPAATVAAHYLAGAGVGELAVRATLVDELRAVNPHVRVRAHDGAGEATTAIVDGSTISIAAEDEAHGAALAVEALKAALGLQHATRVSLDGEAR